MSLALLFALDAELVAGLGLEYPLHIVLDDPESIVAGDSYPYIVGTLVQASGAPIDLTTATGLTFIAATSADGRDLANGPAEILDPAGGTFRYRQTPGDFYLASGPVVFVVRIAFPGGQQTVPNDAPAQLTVTASLT